MYGAWWLWARGSAGDERHTDLASILLIPAWGFTALGAVLKALTGLGYRFPQTPGTTAGDAGPALALAVLAVLGWRLRRRPMPRGFWPALAVAIGLWTSQALGSTNYLSTPTSVRYLLPGSIIVLMAAVAAAGRPRWSRNGLLALWAVAAVGVATNLTLLRNSGRERRDLLTVQDRAMLAGLEIAGPATVTGFRFDGLAGSSDVAFAFVSYIPIHGGGAAERYFRAADRYGDVGYSVPSLRGQAEPVRALADKALVAALGLKLARGSRSTPRGACRPVAAQGATTTFALPTGAGVLLEGATGPVQVRRFASASAVAIGAPQPGQPAVLRLPRDRAPAVPWTVTVPGTAVRVCAMG
jgi:uncharacterized protein (TIGR03382 family)